MSHRIETDSIGKIEVPADRYWGAQTQRSKDNFKIGGQLMPLEVVRAFAILKKAAAQTNADLTDFPQDKADIIGRVRQQIIQCLKTGGATISLTKIQNIKFIDKGWFKFCP